MPKLIKVTETDGTKCVINADLIVRIYEAYDMDRERPYSIVSFCGRDLNKSYRETPREIVDLINGDGALVFEEEKPAEVTVTLAAGGRLTVRADRIRAGGHFGENLETDIFVKDSRGTETVYSVLESPGAIRKMIKDALRMEGHADAGGLAPAT